MQAAPARYVSVSELYSTDEVELLLDEIRELEPTSCRGEDVQDFEIAGSGACGGGGGGRSPCGTEVTERSWDSHAGYVRAASAARDGTGARPVAPLYCAVRRLVCVRTLLVVTCAGACAALWAAVGLRVARAPHAQRLQLLLFAALSSALLHAAILAAHVTRLDALLPIDWRMLGVCTSVWSVVSLCAGGAVTLHVTLNTREYIAASSDVFAPLVTAAALALCGAALALVMSARVCMRRRAAPRTAAPHAYRAVPTTHTHTDAL